TGRPADTCAKKRSQSILDWEREYGIGHEGHLHQVRFDAVHMRHSVDRVSRKPGLPLQREILAESVSAANAESCAGIKRDVAATRASDLAQMSVLDQIGANIPRGIPAGRKLH